MPLPAIPAMRNTARPAAVSSGVPGTILLAAAIFVASAGIVLSSYVYPDASDDVRGLTLLAGMAVSLMGGALCLHSWRAVRIHIGRLNADAVELDAARRRAEADNFARLRFFATVSHEIRTPISGIIGMSSLLFDTELTAEQRSYLTAIDFSSRALVSIVDEVLDTAKIESAQASLDGKPFSVPEMLEGIAELMAPRAHAKGIEVAVYASRRLPHRLIGDASRLRQVFFNLVGNAIKFTDRGGVLVRAEPAASENGQCRVMFSVSDTGIGMSQQETRRIFEDFAQANEDTAHRYGGHGLGLSISRDLLRLMGGDIACSSTPGSGSVFSFALTFGMADADGAADADLRSFAGRRVSLALPEGPTRTSVAATLEDFGATVELVATGAELAAALTSLTSQSLGGHDIIVDAGNVDLLRNSLADGPGALWPNPHVWLLLAPEQRRLFQDLMGSSHAGYLLKPVRRETLVGQLVDRDRMRLSQAIAGLRTKAAIASSGHTGGLHVLLAEDDPVGARLASAMLEKSGHRVSHVVNGKLAVEFVVSSVTAPDLVLMDMEMPDTGGLDATRSIRAFEAARGRPAVPILALTATAGADNNARCRAAGMNGFLAKPFDSADLNEAIARLARRTAA